MSDENRQLPDALKRLAKAAYEQGYKHGFTAAAVGLSIKETER